MIPLLFLTTVAFFARAADWPVYGNDLTYSFHARENATFPMDKEWVYKTMPPTPAHPDLTTAHANNAEDQASHFHAQFYDHAPSPIIVSNRVYINATAEEAVFCLDRDTGDEVWAFWAEGAVRMAPQYDDGKIYFGSDDGHAYCVDADDGSLVWKARGTTNTERRAMMHGRMSAAWPVRTSVAVESNKAYFGAGVLAPNGCYLTCVDADTGAVQWRSTVDYPMSGHIVLDGPRIIIGTGRTMPAEYSKADGTQNMDAYVDDRWGGGMPVGRIDGMVLSGPSEQGVIAIRASTGVIDDDFTISKYRYPGSFTYLEANKIIADDERIYIAHESEERGGWPKRYDQPKYLMAVDRDYATNRFYWAADNYSAHVADAPVGWEGRGRHLGPFHSDYFLIDDLQSNALWAVTNRAEPNWCYLITSNALFAGGTNEVVAYNPATGAELWSATVSGMVFELAFEDGALYAGTDEGFLYCFKNGGAGGLDESARTFDSSPYPTNDALYDKYVEAANLAMSESGVTNGYCLVLGANEGRLCYEIAQRSGFFVVGMEADSNKVAIARTNLIETGLYGHRVVVHTDGDELFPHPDYFASVILSEELLLNGSMPYSSREVFRMLRPYGGTVLFGVQSGDLDLDSWTAQDMTAWTNVTSSEGITWKLAKRTEKDGFGSWNYEYGDAGNTLCSADTFCDTNFVFQWMGEKNPDDNVIDRHNLPCPPVWAEGRIVYMGKGYVWAIDAYNGRKLWERSVPKAVRMVASHDAPMKCLVGHKLYLATSNTCLVIDARTGRTLDAFQGPISSDDWGYVGVYSNMLYGSNQEPDASQDENGSAAVLYGNMSAGSWPVVSKNFFAKNPDTGTVQWEYTNGVILNQSITIGGTNIFFAESRNSTAKNDADGRVALNDFVASDAYWVALDKDTGDVVWEQSMSPLANPGGQEVARFLSYAQDRLIIVATYWDGYADRTNKGYYVYRLLDAADGSQIGTNWTFGAFERGGGNTTDHNMTLQRPNIMGDYAWLKLYTDNRNMYRVTLSNGAMDVVDYGQNIGAKGCTPPSASSQSIYFRAYSIRGVNVLNKTAYDVTGVTRPSCWPSIIPAGGMLLMPEGSSGCGCGMAVQTSVGLSVNDEDVTPPGIFSAEALNQTNVLVIFNEAVDKTTAENTANYVITNEIGAVTVQSAERTTNRLERVLLTVSSMPLYMQYLTVDNVEDLYGNAISTAVKTNFFAGEDTLIEVSTNVVSVPETSTNVFNVRLSEEPSSVKTVTVARISGDTDITVSGGSSLVFNLSTWSTWQTVTLSAAADADWVGETAIVRCAAANLQNTDVTAVEADDDTEVTIDVSADAVTIDEGSTNTFTVRLTAQPAYTVTVTVQRVSGDTDITVDMGSALVFTTGDWNQWQTVSLAAAEDGDESHGTVTIRCSATDMSDVDVTATEHDNDISIDVDTSALDVPEGSTNVFGVRLSREPDAPMTATVANVSGDADLIVSNGASMVFGTGDWNVYQYVLLAAANDPDDTDGSATIRCSLPGYPNEDVTATEIDDDDVTAPQLVSLTVINKNTLEVQYNESMNETSVTDIANYTITTGVSVTSADLGADTQTVTLTVTTLQSADYTLFISNVQDLAYNPITATQTNFSFVNDPTLAHEPFDYDEDFVGGQNGGTGWTNAWSANTNWTIVDPGTPLVYSNAAAGIVVNGGNRAARYSGGPNVDEEVVMRGVTNVAGNVYVSFLANWTNGGVHYNDHITFGTTETDSNNESGPYFGRFASGTSDNLGGAKAGVNNSAAELPGTAVTLDETYFVVGKMEWDAVDSRYEVCRMWINPDSAQTESAAYHIAATNTGGWAAGGMHTWQLIAEAGYEADDRVLIDEIRIGATWNAVVKSLDTAGPADQDGDGIPDDYEEQYGGGPTNLDAEADNDGDGLSNFEEYIADTVPTNERSVLAIDVVQPAVQGSNYVITWQSRSNRFYGVSWMTNLFDIDLQPLISNLPGDPPQNIWTDETHGAEQKGYYRIDVRIE